KRVPVVPLHNSCLALHPWGSINCSSCPLPEPVYVGYTLHHRPKGFGSGSSLCVGRRTLMDSMELGEDTPKSYLNGLTYRSCVQRNWSACAPLLSVN
ncbi:hypothetical protein TNIN_478131, partial [Trichonephila inaurata madagascariensis]